MMRFLVLGTLGLLSLFFHPCYSAADSPGGIFVIPANQLPDVWDVSGNYSENDFGVTNNFTLVQDDKGKITGQGNASSVQGSLNVGLNFDIRGKIKVVGGTTRVDLKARYKGQATDGIQVYRARGNISFKSEVNNATNELVGTAKGTICIRRIGCLRINDPITFTIPPPEDGTWTLTLNINDTIPNKLFGTGTATLINGRQEVFTLDGNYNSRTDVSKLRLKGTAGKITMHVQIVSAVVAIQRMTGKMLGQDVKNP